MDFSRILKVNLLVPVNCSFPELLLFGGWYTFSRLKILSVKLNL